jgi:hypothetical protein
MMGIGETGRWSRVRRDGNGLGRRDTAPRRSFCQSGQQGNHKREDKEKERSVKYQTKKRNQLCEGANKLSRRPQSHQASGIPEKRELLVRGEDNREPTCGGKS